MPPTTTATSDPAGVAAALSDDVLAAVAALAPDELDRRAAARAEGLRRGRLEEAVRVRLGAWVRAELVCCGRGCCAGGGKNHGPYWQLYVQVGPKLLHRYAGKHMYDSARPVWRRQRAQAAASDALAGRLWADGREGEWGRLDDLLVAVGLLDPEGGRRVLEPVVAWARAWDAVGRDCADGPVGATAKDLGWDERDEVEGEDDAGVGGDVPAADVEDVVVEVRAAAVR